MRDYSIVKPSFWIGKTGRQLRGHAEAQVLAFYLMTGPHATMTGVFHCPVMYMAHETGLGMEGASKGLQRLEEVGFCFYDHDLETVLVISMLKYQVGDQLKPTDNRVKGIKKQYEATPESRAKAAFSEVYWQLIGIEKPSTNILTNTGESQAPSKPLRSQDQEQEQEQDKTAAQSQKSSSLGLPLIGGGFFVIKPDMLERFKELYPDVDAEQEIRNMLGHFDSDPTDLRPRTQIQKFINTWLANRQRDFLVRNQTHRDDELGLDDTNWANDLVIPDMEQSL